MILRPFISGLMCKPNQVLSISLTPNTNEKYYVLQGNVSKLPSVQLFQILGPRILWHTVYIWQGLSFNHIPQIITLGKLRWGLCSCLHYNGLIQVPQTLGSQNFAT